MRVLQCLWHTRAICLPTRLTAPKRCADVRTLASSACSAEQSRRSKSESIKGSTHNADAASVDGDTGEERGAEVPYSGTRRIWLTPRPVDVHAPEAPSKGSRRNRLTQPPTTSIDEFQQRVEQNTATVQDAAECLRAHRAEIEALPYAGRRKACQDIRAGGRVLEWVLVRRAAGIHSNRTFSDNLMWFAIGEDNEDIIWSWIAIELKKEDYTRFRRDIIPLVARLLASLAAAHRAWAPDYCPETRNGSPNAALLCFKRAVETVPQHLHPGCLSSISDLIAYMLEREECPPADLALFEFYADRPGHFEKRRSTWADCSADVTSLLSEQRTLGLALYHPIKPDGTAFMHSLRNSRHAALRLETHAAWSATRPWMTNVFAAQLLRLSYILRLQGNAVDVDWIVQCVERKVPQVWKHRQSLEARFLKDPKLVDLRRGSAELALQAAT